MPRSNASWLFVLLLAVALSCAQGASAHDVMGSVFYVDLGHSRVHLEVELPLDELRLALGQPSQPGVVEPPADGPTLAAYLLEHLSLSTPDGAPFSLRARAADITLHDARNWQHIEVEATPPAGASSRDFVLHSDVIDHRVVSHHLFIFLRRDLAGGQLGEPVYLATLHYQILDARVQRAAGSLGAGLVATMRLGADHILEGSDHLLFLLALLLPAGLTAAHRRWGARKRARQALVDVARIVTAFTLGHSLTLLLGALGFPGPSAAVVESLIALSVLISALHALRPIFSGREAWLALGFGLVHGLAFARALAGFGVDGTTLVISVLGFNLGIEAMQVLLVLALLPSLFVLQATPLGAPLRQLGGVCASVAALAWFAQRAFGLETPIPGWVDAGFAQGVWVGAALALLALIALLAPRSWPLFCSAHGSCTSVRVTSGGSEDESGRCDDAASAHVPSG